MARVDWRCIVLEFEVVDCEGVRDDRCLKDGRAVERELFGYSKKDQKDKEMLMRREGNVETSTLLKYSEFPHQNKNTFN